MKRLSAIIVCTFVLLQTLAALDIEAATGRFGVDILNNTLPVTISAVSPVMNTLGGSVIITFADGYFLTLEPGLDLFWTNYENLDGRAVPTEYERGAGNNVFVLGFLLDVPLTATLRFGAPVSETIPHRFAVGFSLGPAFVLRAGFKYDLTAGMEAAMAENQKAVVSYFWEKGRWFYPAAGIRFEIALQERFSFLVGARGFLPIFNAWTGTTPFLDHSMIHFLIGMRVKVN